MIDATDCETALDACTVVVGAVEVDGVHLTKQYGWTSPSRIERVADIVRLARAARSRGHSGQVRGFARKQLTFLPSSGSERKIAVFNSVSAASSAEIEKAGVLVEHSSRSSTADAIVVLCKVSIFGSRPGDKSAPLAEMPILGIEKCLVVACWCFGNDLRAIVR